MTFNGTPFNDEQLEHMRSIAQLPDEQVSWCGWGRAGDPHCCANQDCVGKKTKKTLADRKAAQFEQWFAAPGEAPATWAGFPWPEWIPADQRAQIEKFWGVQYSRGPQAWFRDHEVQGMPYTGERITTEDIFSRARDEEGQKPSVTGRYVHAWNNMGRLVLDDGRCVCVSHGYKKAARYLAAQPEGQAK